MLGSIVWSCCGRRTVGSQSGLCWSHCGNQPCSATATRPHSALYRQTKFSTGTDQLFNWTLDRLICSVTSLARLSPQRGKSNMADRSAKLNPSKPAAQMFTLTRLTDGSIRILFKSSVRLMFCGIIPVIQPGTTVCHSDHFFVFFW